VEKFHTCIKKCTQTPFLALRMPLYYTSVRKICYFTENRDHINKKSKETRVVAYSCRYSSGPLISNSATATD